MFSGFASGAVFSSTVTTAAANDLFVDRNFRFSALSRFRRFVRTRFSALRECILCAASTWKQKMHLLIGAKNVFYHGNNYAVCTLK